MLLTNRLPDLEELAGARCICNSISFHRLAGHCYMRSKRDTCIPGEAESNQRP